MSSSRKERILNCLWPLLAVFLDALGGELRLSPFGFMFSSFFVGSQGSLSLKLISFGHENRGMTGGGHGGNEESGNLLVNIRKTIGNSRRMHIDGINPYHDLYITWYWT